MITVFLILLLTMLMFFPPGFAENYGLYQIPVHLENTNVFSFDSEDTFSFQSSEKYLLWEKNGQTVAVLSQENYKLLNSYVRVIQLENGQYGILMQDDAIRESCRIEYWIWSEHSIEMIRAWEDASSYLAYCDKGFLILNSKNHIVLYDCYARELWQEDFRESEGYQPHFLRMRSAEDWIISLYARDASGQHYVCIRLVNGIVAWRSQFESIESCIVRFLPLANGWTLVTFSRNDGKYGPIEVSILDPEGIRMNVYEISSNRELLSRSTLLLEGEDGQALIYGSSVSKRQGIFLVWELHFDPQSGTSFWDLRNSEYHDDYFPPLTTRNTQQIHETPVFVKLCAMDGSSAPTVCIPFEELPVVTEQLLFISRD